MQGFAIADQGQSRSIDAFAFSIIEHRSFGDPRQFFLYEQYVDEVAYQVHVESAHAKQYALTEGIPNLESREQFVCETLGSW